MENVFQIFEKSYQIDRIVTPRHIAPSFAAYKLAMVFEYRPSQEYWASITIDGVETRYKLEDGDGELVETMLFSKIVK